MVWNRVWYTRKPRLCITVFVVLIANEYKEKKCNMRVRNGFFVFFFWLFCCNDDIVSVISACCVLRPSPGLKTSVENDVFWSEIGSGFS